MPEFVREYAVALTEDLTNISKVVIDTLTTLAAENKQYAEGVAAALLKHAHDVSSSEGKFPSVETCFGVSLAGLEVLKLKVSRFLIILQILAVYPRAQTPRPLSRG